MLYILIFILMTLLSFDEIFSKNMRRPIANFKVNIFCIIFLVLSTIRWERGTDWLSYINYFKNIDSIPFSKNKRFEIGYKIVNYFVASFSDNYTILLFVLAFIIFYFQRKSVINIAKQSFLNQVGNKKKYYYPFTMLFIIWSLYIGNIFVVRTSISFIILFYSIIYIHNKKIIKFLLLLIFATLFHRSSIAFIIAYPIYHLKLNKKIFTLTFALSPFIIYYFDEIMLFIANILGGRYEQKVINYLNVGEPGGEILGLANILFLNIVFLHMYFSKKMRYNYQFSGMYNLFYFGSLIYVGTYVNTPILTRIAIPFMMSQIVLIPYIFTRIKKNNLKLFVFLIMVLYLGLRHYSVLNSYWNLYIPFKTIFNKGLDIIIY